MTPEGEYRRLAQQIRQTVRAQLHQIRLARLGHPLAPQGDAPKLLRGAGLGLLERQQKRQRRTDRLVRLTRQTQDARLDAAMASGAIELWDGLLKATPDEAVVPEVPEMPEYFGPVWDTSVQATDLQGLAPEPEFFGPVWEPDFMRAASTVDTVENLPLPEFFGPWPDRVAAEVVPLVECGVVDLHPAADVILSEATAPMMPEVALTLTLSVGFEYAAASAPARFSARNYRR